MFKGRIKSERYSNVLLHSKGYCIQKQGREKKKKKKRELKGISRITIYEKPGIKTVQWAQKPNISDWAGKQIASKWGENITDQGQLVCLITVRRGELCQKI